MSLIIFGNNAQGVLSGAITNAALTVSLNPGQGALFPSPGAGQFFVGTFNDAATGLLDEIVHVTNVTGDVLTIVRAQEGTAAQAWNAGDLFANLWTAGSAAAMLQNGQTPTQPARIETLTSVSLNILLTDYAVGLNRAATTQTLNLPNGAAVGQSFKVEDLAGTFSPVNPVTVAPPAGTIAGLASFKMNEARQSAIFTYYGSNLWSVAS